MALGEPVTAMTFEQWMAFYFQMHPGTTQGLFEKPTLKDVFNPGLGDQYHGIQIPKGFYDVYGPKPLAASYRAGPIYRQRAEVEYEQWLKGFGGLIVEGDPDWMPVSDEAAKLYEEYEMGKVILFHGKIGISAAFSGSAHKAKRLWMEPSTYNKDYPTPLRPYRWEGDADARDDIENARLIIATYQVLRINQGLPVAKPIFANIAPKNP